MEADFGGQEAEFGGQNTRKLFYPRPGERDQRNAQGPLQSKNRASLAGPCKNLTRQPSLAGCGGFFTLRAPRRGGDRESFRASFRENSSKNLILQIFRTHGDIENYAPSKFQPRTTLGGAKNVKKTKKKFGIFHDFGIQFFVIFDGFWRS